MSQTCPNCKHENIAVTALSCPACNWTLQSDSLPTLETPESIPNPSPGLDLAATLAAPQTPLTEPESTLLAPANAQLPPTLVPPRQPSANFEAATLEPPVTLGESERTLPRTVIGTGSIELTRKPQSSIQTVIPERSISTEIVPGRLQDYKIEKRIGSGSFGVVFQAQQVPLDRTVALKVLTSADNADATQREQMQIEFLREAQFTGKLEHPNIVPIHDIGLTYEQGSSTGRPFYVMKEIHGTSWMNKIDSLSLSENLDIFKRVVDAIGFAHSKNVLHCDLKPENVMLGEYGEVLLVDWGQAIDLSAPESIRPGGTPAYISPEMASYWCDLYLDKIPDPPARAQIGPSCDVYSLGAMLFELVTQQLLRSLNVEEGESPYDVMRRACNNDIKQIAGYENDELMQIARRALRISDELSIETIADLQGALKNYEARSLSIQLRQRADQLLVAAESNRSYDDFQKAKLGYEESLEKWNGNYAAKLGLKKSRLSCAAVALEDQNFDLGIGVLNNPNSDNERTLYRELVAGKAKRDRRKQLVRWLAWGLSASILIGLAVSGWSIRESNRLLSLRDEAVLKRDEAVVLRDLAFAERQKVKSEIKPLQDQLAKNNQLLEANETRLQQQQLEISEFPQKLVAEKQRFEQQLANEKRRSEADLEKERIAGEAQVAIARKKSQQEMAAVKQTAAAEIKTVKQQTEAEKTELIIEVKQLEQSSKLLQAKAATNKILQELDAGNYRLARELLDSVENKNTMEWRRLNLLAHREVESVYPDDSIHCIAASVDGKKLAWGFDNGVEVHTTEELTTNSVTIRNLLPAALAFSRSGQTIAIGVTGGDGSANGEIQLFDLSDKNLPRLMARLNAPSKEIQTIAFCDDDRRLLCVGVPSFARKSAGNLESELMVWQRDDSASVGQQSPGARTLQLNDVANETDWQRVDVTLADNQAKLPAFSSAQFSPDGKTILATNPLGLSREQGMNLFSDSGNGFRWVARSPIAGVKTAVFINGSANQIVAGAVDMETGKPLLIEWTTISRSGSNRPRAVASDQVSVESGRGQASITEVATLNSPALYLDFNDGQLLVAHEDKTLTLFDWNTKASEVYRGHSKQVDFCKLIPDPGNGLPSLISASLGAEPEVLRTDLKTYQSEVVAQSLAPFATADRPSPSAYFQNRDSNAVVLGNDQGQVAVRAKNTIQWEVSAWRRHFVTDNFLFAQSRRDLFYQYDLESGAVVRVLTKLAAKRNGNDGPHAEIEAIDFSADGTRAVVVFSSNRNRFEIWDLRTERRLRTIDYRAADVFGTGSDKTLLDVRISSDGSKIVAGKVGLFAWDTNTGQPIDLNQSAVERARTSINSIHFVAGTSLCVVTWAGRLDVLDLSGIRAPRRFQIDELVDSKTESNLLDVASQNGTLLALVRVAATNDASGGIALYDLNDRKVLKRFPSASVARFSNRALGQVLVVTNLGRQAELSRFDRASNSSTSIKPQFTGDLVSRFRSFDQVFETPAGTVLLQTTTSNGLNPVRENWNTISVGEDGQLENLVVLAKPMIDEVAVAGNVVLTLDKQRLRFWELSATSVRPLGNTVLECRNMALSADNDLLLVVAANGKSVSLVSPMSQAEIAAMDFQKISGFAADANVAVWASERQPRFLVGFNDGSVHWFDWNGKSIKKSDDQVISSSETNLTIAKLLLSSDGNTLVTLFENQALVRVSRLSQNKWNSFLLANAEGVNVSAADLSRDGTRLTTGSERGRLTIWNVEPLNQVEASQEQEPTRALPRLATEREIFSLPARHQSAITFVHLDEASPNETKIISAEANSGNNEFLIWPLSK